MLLFFFVLHLLVSGGYFVFATVFSVLLFFSSYRFTPELRLQCAMRCEVALFYTMAGERRNIRCTSEDLRNDTRIWRQQQFRLVRVRQSTKWEARCYAVTMRSFRNKYISTLQWMQWKTNQLKNCHENASFFWKGSIDAFGAEPKIQILSCGVLRVDIINQRFYVSKAILIYSADWIIVMATAAQSYVRIRHQKIRNMKQSKACLWFTESRNESIFN